MLISQTMIISPELSPVMDLLWSSSGANHYGIADTNNPLGSVPDPNTPQIEQSQAVETVARWSALFLRAEVLGDRQVFDYVYKTGNALDNNVSVISQQ